MEGGRIQLDYRELGRREGEAGGEDADEGEQGGGDGERLNVLVSTEALPKASVLKWRQTDLQGLHLGLTTLRPKHVSHASLPRPLYSLPFHHLRNDKPMVRLGDPDGRVGVVWGVIGLPVLSANQVRFHLAANLKLAWAMDDGAAGIVDLRELGLDKNDSLYLVLKTPQKGVFRLSHTSDALAPSDLYLRPTDPSHRYMDPVPFYTDPDPCPATTATPTARPPPLRLGHRAPDQLDTLPSPNDDLSRDLSHPPPNRARPRDDPLPPPNRARPRHDPLPPPHHLHSHDGPLPPPTHLPSLPSPLEEEWGSAIGAHRGAGVAPAGSPSDSQWEETGGGAVEAEGEGGGGPFGARDSGPDRDDASEDSGVGPDVEPTYPWAEGLAEYFETRGRRGVVVAGEKAEERVSRETSSGRASEYQSLSDSDLCFFCCAAVADAQFVPCGHASSCHKCASRIWNDGSYKKRAKCPFCQALLSGEPRRVEPQGRPDDAYAPRTHGASEGEAEGRAEPLWDGGPMGEVVEDHWPPTILPFHGRNPRTLRRRSLTRPQHTLLD